MERQKLRIVVNYLVWGWKEASQGFGLCSEVFSIFLGDLEKGIM